MFPFLDAVRQKHGVTDVLWAEQSGLKYGSRISELRRISTLHLEGDDTRKVGRAMSPAKCVLLLNGLVSVLGWTTVAKDLLQEIKKSKSGKERLLMLVLLLDEQDEEQIEAHIRALVSARENSK